MDYESRKVKWHWLLLFILHSAAVVYLIFKGNPLLYSHLELRSSLTVSDSKSQTTIPTNPEVLDKLSEITFVPRYNLSRTAVDTIAVPRSKDYVEFEKHSLNLGVPDFLANHISYDRSGFYFVNTSQWAIAVSPGGEVRWKYAFKKSSAGSLLPALLDERLIYLVQSDGQIVCLDKANGSLRWALNLKQKVVAPPILWNDQILIPTKATTGVQLRMVKRLNGRVMEESPVIEVKQPNVDLTYADALKVMLVTVGTKVIALSPTTWSVQWTQTLTDPAVGPAVASGTQIFFATLGAKVIKIDGSKKGKLEWEADIQMPAVSAPVYLPVINRLAVMDTNGAISAVDAKTGKILWRVASENRNPANEVWGARISGKYIEDYQMDWLHKGWTFWSPCADSRVCIYTPNKGQVVDRLALSGRPLTLPLPLEKRWVFISRQKSGGYTISHLVEEMEAKRLRESQSSNKTVD